MDLDALLSTKDDFDQTLNVADGLLAIAYALNRVADSINTLGSASGPLDILGNEIKEGTKRIANALNTEG